MKEREWRRTPEEGLKRSQAKQDQLACLVGFMDEYMKPIFELRRSLVNGSLTEVLYTELWHLFQPGDLVISNSSKLSDTRQAYRVLHVTGGRPIWDSDVPLDPYVTRRRYVEPIDEDDEYTPEDTMMTVSRITPIIIDLFYLDYDGSRFGPRSRRVRVEEYKGCKAISALEVVPLRFIPKASHVQQTLIARGRQYINLVPTAHKLYEGLNTLERNDYEEQVSTLSFLLSRSHYMLKFPGE